MVRRSEQAVIEAWEGMAPLVGAPCPSIVGERAQVVAFVQPRRVRPSTEPLELLIAGELVLAASDGLEPWTWAMLTVECLEAPDRFRHVPARVRVLVVHATCPAEAPERAVRRRLARQRRGRLARRRDHQRGSEASSASRSAADIGLANR